MSRATRHLIAGRWEASTAPAVLRKSPVEKHERPAPQPSERYRCCRAGVRYWHETDMTGPVGNVSSWGAKRKSKFGVVTSAFEPTTDIAAWRAPAVAITLRNGRKSFAFPRNPDPGKFGTRCCHRGFLFADEWPTP